MKTIQYSFKGIKKLAKDLNNGNELPNDLPKDVVEVVKQTAKSLKFLDEKKSMKFIVERLRPNTVGDILSTKDNQPVIALNRGKPEGFIAAISDGSRVYFGISYFVPNEEKYVIPCIGEALALERAIDNMKKMMPNYVKMFKKHHKRQIDHFYNRAKAYFMPEKYSYSRGSEPLDYYDKKLHDRQEYAKLLKSNYIN